MYNLYINDINDFDYLSARKELSYPIITRCDRYKVEEKRKQSVIGYYLLKQYLLKDFKIELYDVSINEYGKPFIDEIYFNISHSNNMIAIIISDNPCGIDVEYEDIRCLKLAKKILNNSELSYFNNLSDDLKLEYVMKKWVSLEAYSKMIGNNLNLKLEIEIKADKVYLKNDENPYYLAKFVKK